MSKYFIDVKFLEGTQKTWFGHTKPTIDLISIGIVCEDGREYYAISKDFNLKEAWNRYYIKSMSGKGGIGENTHDKIYWIRENVLKPIYNELTLHHTSANWYYKNPHLGEKVNDGRWLEFNYKSLKWLISKYGKSNKQIAEEIKEFCKPKLLVKKGDYLGLGDTNNVYEITTNKLYGGDVVEKTAPEFYGYYSDYDWVVFCWLFGKMIDLPKGFPMYCIDLKQTLDEKINNYHVKVGTIKKDFNSTLNDIKSFDSYPKQTNEHHALADARWNKQLYEFLNRL